MALYKFCIIIIIIIIVIIITFISVVLLLVHRFICSVLLLTYASSSTKNCHLLTMSVALLADVSTDWSSCVRSHTNTHFGHQNRYGECSGHQPHWLLQRSHVCRAWPSSPTTTRNAHSVGADDLSAQKIRPHHRSILFDTLYWLPSVKRWSTNYTRSSASAFMAWSHRTLWICDNQFPMSLAVFTFLRPQWSGCPANQKVDLWTSQFSSVGRRGQQAGTHYLNRSVTQRWNSENSNADWKRRCSVWPTCVIWLRTRDCLGC